MPFAAKTESIACEALLTGTGRFMFRMKNRKDKGIAAQTAANVRYYQCLSAANNRHSRTISYAIPAEVTHGFETTGTDDAGSRCGKSVEGRNRARHCPACPRQADQEA